MARKVIWLDTETTGLDCKSHAMIQFAALIEINEQVVEEINLFFRPMTGQAIDATALKINKRKVPEIMEFPHQAVSLESLKKTLAKYVKKRDPADKFIIAGKNAGAFDVGFIRQTFLNNDDPYYGSWFFNCVRDVEALVAQAVLFRGLRPKNFKLGTLCSLYGVQLGNSAHNALSDVRATRDLYYAIAVHIRTGVKI